MLSCPESPVWLVLSGQRREAEETAARLWGPEGALQLGGGALPPCQCCVSKGSPGRRLQMFQ